MHTRKDVATTPTKRGNLPISMQDKRPDWITKPGYLALGALRAQGVGQLRRMFDALQQRHFPLSQPEVVTLVRQVLYHIGTLSCSDQGPPLPLWRTDGGVRETCCPLCAKSWMRLQRSWR